MSAPEIRDSADNPLQNPAQHRSLIAFVIVQAIILSCGLGWAAARIVKLEADKAWPPFRERPLVVRPQYDYPQVVSDEQLQTVLHRLRPQFKSPRPTINHVDHALRLWGLDAVFDDAKCLSGQDMRKLLLDDEEFVKAWGKKTSPLLIDSEHGVKVRLQEGLGTMSHTDHTLAVQAEVGTSIDYPVVTRRGETTLRALLEQSLHDFNFNQVEYEWSILTYALFMAPDGPGRTGEGQRVTFDDFADRIMRQRLPDGVCFGNHRLHTLTMLLRIDDQMEHRMLAAPKRNEIMKFLQSMTAALVKNQHADGYWDEKWALGLNDAVAGPVGANAALRNRILATGHALEWWSLAPAELHPPRETLVRAGQWVCRTIEEMSDKAIAEEYTFLSHAARALALWRGHFPEEIYVPVKVEAKEGEKENVKEDATAKPPAQAGAAAPESAPATNEKKLQ